jgi:hypothetical protein
MPPHYRTTGQPIVDIAIESREKRLSWLML